MATIHDDNDHTTTELISNYSTGKKSDYSPKKQVLDPKVRLQLVLQGAREIYARAHPESLSDRITQEAVKELEDFVEWLSGLDKEVYEGKKTQIKVPCQVHLSDTTRKELEAMGVSLVYLHSSYGWFMNIPKTCS